MLEESNCLQCSLIARADELPGGIVAEHDNWLVFHAPGSWNLGTLALLPRRHVARVGELNDEESAPLGVLLRDVAAAVSAIREPSQVYVNQWAHRDGVATHIHFILEPIDAELMAAHPGLLGPALQARILEAGNGPSPDDVTMLAAAAAAFLDRRRHQESETI